MQFARDLDARDTDKFVGMYVNEHTLDYGDDGREAVANFSTWATKKALSRPQSNWSG